MNKFKPGDIVVYKGCFKRRHGDKSTFVRRDIGICFVDFPWGREYSLPERSLEKYDPPKPFTFDDYQEAASGTAIYDKALDVVYPAMGLANEAGEVLGKVKKKLRDKTDYDVDALKAEIGDVLWYMAALCNDLDLDLEDVAISNLEKLQSRKERGVIGGSGDYR